MRTNCSDPPQGALRQRDGSVVWRVWAPASPAVSLVTTDAGGCETIAMRSEGGGYFVHREPRVAEGLRYKYRLSDAGDYPDPASRWQPEGVHGDSSVFFPDTYGWSDETWKGIARRELVIYELHVGVFTPQGTLDAIVPRLPQLMSLGVTALELMPVAQFAGDRNWGYDAVYPYAVQNSYGGPRALQRLVDAAHKQGMGVILDVIYNHFGPEGNYLSRYGPYFTDRYRTPWGTAVNFDGPQSDAVRRFVVDNARMWVRDFHVDGLRLDAVHAIYDFGARHILAEIKAAVQREAGSAGRIVHVIAESNQNDVRLIRSPARGGFGLDGVWNDDFHHSVHSLLSGERDGYYQDFGEAAHLAKSFNRVFVYDGCYSPFRRRRHGSRVGATDRTRFVVCVQNHDQVGNRARGDRPSESAAPPAQRLACGLLLLSPFVPLLFMGEEYGETSPFAFFCSFGDPQLIEAVRRGRREEFAALKFKWGGDIPDPQDPRTFAACKLKWAWPQGSPQSQRRLLYEDLLKARRDWPVLGDRQNTNARVVNSSEANRADIMLIRRGGEEGLLIAANLTADKSATDVLQLAGKKAILSTEDMRYGGGRLPQQSWEELLPYELIVFADSGGRE